MFFLNCSKIFSYVVFWFLLQHSEWWCCSTLATLPSYSFITWGSTIQLHLFILHLLSLTCLFKHSQNCTYDPRNIGNKMLLTIPFAVNYLYVAPRFYKWKCEFSCVLLLQSTSSWTRAELHVLAFSAKHVGDIKSRTNFCSTFVYCCTSVCLIPTSRPQHSLRNIRILLQKIKRFNICTVLQDSKRNLSHHQYARHVK